MNKFHRRQNVFLKGANFATFVFRILLSETIWEDVKGKVCLPPFTKECGGLFFPFRLGPLYYCLLITDVESSSKKRKKKHIA